MIMDDSKNFPLGNLETEAKFYFISILSAGGECNRDFFDFLDPESTDLFNF
jgi:hypothetical protein